MADDSDNSRRPAVRKTKTGIPGVSILLNGKYGAQASRKRKTHWLGTFRTIRQAEAAINEFKRESERLAEEEQRESLARYMVLGNPGHGDDLPVSPPKVNVPSDIVKRTRRCSHCSMPEYFRMRLRDGSKVLILSWSAGGPRDAYPIVGIFFEKLNRVGVAMSWAIDGKPYRGASFDGLWLDLSIFEREHRQQQQQQQQQQASSGMKPKGKNRDVWLSDLLPQTEEEGENEAL